MLTWLKARAQVALSTCVFAGVYLYLYVNDIAPIFAYMGLGFDPGPLVLVLFCFLLGLAPALWLPLHVRRPSQVVLWFLFLMVYLPALLTPVLVGRFASDVLISASVSLCLCFLFINLLVGRVSLRAPQRTISDPQYRLLLVSLFVLFALVCVRTYGLPTGVPSLLDVHDVRAELRSSYEGTSRLTGYASHWLGRVVTTLLFVYGISTKRLGLVLAAVLGQLFVFSILAERALFFSLAFVALVMVLLRGRRNFFGPKVLLGSSLLLILGKVQAELAEVPIVLSMALRRTLVFPGVNTLNYFEYYSEVSDKVAYAFTGLGGILPFLPSYTEPYSPGRMVGLKYMRLDPSIITNLNANLWAEGFSNAGVAGVFIASAILSCVLLSFDACARRQPIVVSGGLIAASVVGLANGALFTQLVTNGLLLMILLVLLMPPTEEPDQDAAPARRIRALPADLPPQA